MGVIPPFVEDPNEEEGSGDTKVGGFAMVYLMFSS